MHASKPLFLLHCCVYFLISSGDGFSFHPSTTNSINNINIHTANNSRHTHYAFIRCCCLQQKRLYSTLSIPISNEKNNDIDDTATHGIEDTAAHELDATHDVLLNTYIIQWRWVMWLYVSYSYIVESTHSCNEIILLCNIYDIEGKVQKDIVNPYGN